MLRVLILVASLATICGGGCQPAVPKVLAEYRSSQGTPDEIHVREIRRGANTSTVLISAHRFGGAAGGSLDMMACIADIAHQRGMTHFVPLSSEITRYGSPDNPGNDGRMVFGFCDGASPEDLAVFGSAFGEIDPAMIMAVEPFVPFLSELEAYRVSNG